MGNVGEHPGIADAASPGPYDELLARKLDELRGEQAGASPEYFRIRLVKALRESTGLRLTEAADVVDDYYRRRGFAVRSLRLGIVAAAAGGLFMTAVLVALWALFSHAEMGLMLIVPSMLLAWVVWTFGTPLVRAVRDRERRR
jgi:hypothetical protein